jgi:hypothetical protein
VARLDGIEEDCIGTQSSKKNVMLEEEEENLLELERYPSHCSCV